MAFFTSRMNLSKMAKIKKIELYKIFNYNGENTLNILYFQVVFI